MQKPLLTISVFIVWSDGIVLLHLWGLRSKFVRQKVDCRKSNLKLNPGFVVNLNLQGNVPKDPCACPVVENPFKWIIIKTKIIKYLVLTQFKLENFFFPSYLSKRIHTIIWILYIVVENNYYMKVVMAPYPKILCTTITSYLTKNKNMNKRKFLKSLCIKYLNIWIFFITQRVLCHIW